jgi:hypothetical protein
MTVVSIRGTHGSGKSSIVKAILNKYRTDPMKQCTPAGARVKKLKTFGYVVELPKGQTLFVVGSYENACGGCDGIQPYENIWPLINQGAIDCDHVLFEGALVSSSYGSIGRFSEVYGDDMVFAFLDTPLEKCLERIAARRAAKGDTRPVNPYNTASKFNSVDRSLTTIRDKFERRTVVIDHTKATQQVLKLFGVSIRKELPL